MKQRKRYKIRSGSKIEEVSSGAEGLEASRVRGKKVGFFLQYFRLMRFYLVTGLMVWMPLIVTVGLTVWLFNNVLLVTEDLIKRGYGTINRFGERFEAFGFLEGLEYIPGIGVLIVVVLFLATGLLTRYLVGRRFINTGERILNRIPIISRLYRAIQQIRDVFVSREGNVFQQVCIVEYPRPGIFAVAFITSKEQGVVQKALGKEMSSVFLPTTPNPTSGFLLYLPTEDITVLDITVEDAMKLIISGGAFSPKTKADSAKDSTDDDAESGGSFRVPA